MTSDLLLPSDSISIEDMGLLPPDKLFVEAPRGIMDCLADRLSIEDIEPMGMVDWRARLLDNEWG